MVAVDSDHFYAMARPVSSVLAQRVLKAAYAHMPLPFLHRPPGNSYLSGTDQRDIEYQKLVRMLLRRSGLAQALPGCQDLLPDVYARLPYLERQIAELHRPQSLEQLVDHVLEHLPLYLSSEPWGWRAADWKLIHAAEFYFYLLEEYEDSVHK